MSASESTLEVVRAYHRGWSGGQFEQAVRLLAPSLKVEVPINDYPTTDSFAQAVIAFASLTRNVDLLAEFAAGQEAMLLYDMEVEGLGMMRVAEHFTVADGLIARIRQIHDTAALRAAGFVSAA